MNDCKFIKMIRFSSGEYLIINLNSGINFETNTISFVVYVGNETHRYKNLSFKVISADIEYISVLDQDGKPMFKIPKSLLLSTQQSDNDMELLIQALVAEVKNLDDKLPTEHKYLLENLKSFLY